MQRLEVSAAVRHIYICIYVVRLQKVKWTRPFRRKTKSGFCACVITFQTQSTQKLCAVFGLMPAESSASRCRIGTVYCDVRTLHSRMQEGHTLRTFYRVTQARKCGAVPHMQRGEDGCCGRKFYTVSKLRMCVYTCGYVFVYVHTSAPFSHVSIFSAVGRCPRRIRTVDYRKETVHPTCSGHCNL